MASLATVVAHILRVRAFYSRSRVLLSPLDGDVGPVELFIVGGLDGVVGIFSVRIFHETVAGLEVDAVDFAVLGEFVLEVG